MGWPWGAQGLVSGKAGKAKRPQDVPGTESIPLPSLALTKLPPLSRRSEQQMPKKPDQPFQERNGVGLRPCAPPARATRVQGRAQIGWGELISGSVLQFDFGRVSQAPVWGAAQKHMVLHQACVC